jgi:D-amino-acid dehydrogenase
MEVGAQHPAFVDACSSGDIVGGLDAVGFTLNIHNFVTNLLSQLELFGVQFLWNLKVNGISMGADGLVQELVTPNGPLRADHYVVSPGVNCHKWLNGTLTKDKIQGIGGLWLTLPNVDPLLTHSVKLHREGHVGEDSNITIARGETGEPILLLGSGYAFVGNAKLDMDSPEIEILFRALEETARRFLPRNYAKAVSEGTLRGSRKACVRPFTATGLGTFEVLGTENGGRMVITTGHNTGGFTQAPSVAKATLATLDGGFHYMQHKYYPLRGFASTVVKETQSTYA